MVTLQAMTFLLKINIIIIYHPHLALHEKALLHTSGITGSWQNDPRSSLLESLQWVNTGHILRLDAIDEAIDVPEREPTDPFS